MKRTYRLFLTATLIVFSFNVFSKETTLMISIDKQAVSPENISDAIDALNHKDFSTGPCYINSQVDQFIDFENAPYYGVVFVNFKWECDDLAQRFLTQVENSPNYTIYSNPSIGPMPATSGGNTH